MSSMTGILSPTVPRLDSKAERMLASTMPKGESRSVQKEMKLASSECFLMVVCPESAISRLGFNTER